WVG
ncbi:putative tail fiber domain protein, partial [Escherichia coli EC1869]